MMPDGRLNLFFTRRMDAAATLWKAGKVKRLLVSGASDARGYNEPISMRDAIVARGVPIEAIDMDPSGFRTLDSVVRAKTVFGVTRMTMVSQRFHDERAIFLADHSGVDAVGFAAREVGSFEGWWHRGREVLARGKVLLDVYVLGTRPAVEADTPSKPLPAG
jgi:SanA protein